MTPKPPSRILFAMAPKDDTASRHARWLMIVIVAAAGLIFAPNLADSFVSDDFVKMHTLGNDTLGHILNGDNLGGTADYRPLTLAMIWLELHAFGAHPMAFHAVHLILGMLAAVLLFLLVEACFDRRVALLAALAFAVAPAHVENVVWISGVGQVPATALLLGGLWIHVWARRTERDVVAPLGALAFFAALFAHEVVCLAPLILLLIDRHLTPRPTWRASLSAAGIWLAALAIWALIRAVVVGFALPSHYGLFVLRDVARYLQLYFLPLGLDDAIPWVMTHPWAVLGPAVVVLGAIVFFAARLWRIPAFRCGAIAGLLALAPVAHLYPRRLHIFAASAWWAVAVGGLVAAGLNDRRPLLRKVAYLGFGAWLALCLGVAAGQSMLWREAADLAATVVDDLDKAADPPTTDIIVLTVPDTLRGAFVMRNGLHQALRLRRPNTAVVVHHVLLAGLAASDAPGPVCRRTGQAGFEVRQPPGSVHNYLLPPDANRDLQPGMDRRLGPFYYQAVAASRPFGLTAVAVGVDPQLLDKPGAKIMVFDHGRLAPFDGGNSP
ncbi:MAG: hypothetical protein P9L99_15790 [Candidatus Lernaella stagnicola]|nr:hypothetical protein [Candidatus Lernaella stagnicola]